MNQQDPIQAKSDDIRLIDIIRFLRASGSNIAKSTLVCLLAGGAYYFFAPKVYEASTTILLATVAGEPVENPAALLEKMKLPFYFSEDTLQACDADEGSSSKTKFLDKIKPSITSVDKSNPLLSFVAQGQSSKEAQLCLEAVIEDIQKSQNELTQQLIALEKLRVVHLGIQLKEVEEIIKSFITVKTGANEMHLQFCERALVSSSKMAYEMERKNIKRDIYNLEEKFAPPKTRPLSFAVKLTAPQSPVNKRPFFTFGLSLALGVFLGFFITGVQFAEPNIRRQLREAELS